MPKGVYDRSKWVPWNKGKKCPHLSGPNSPLWKSVENICAVCNKKYWIKASHAHSRKTCSRECHKEYRSLYLSGSNAPSWRGGISLYFTRYKGGFKPWMKEYVRERDGHKCMICKIKPEDHGRLQIHHINFQSDDNRLDNLITLCIGCHFSVERLKIYWADSDRMA